MNEEYKILELFSGIGGMHYAFKYSKLRGDIVGAVDINTVANAVYSYNYPETSVFNNNIQKLTPKFMSKLGANMILMSPPCQPFTRVGNQKDINDSRTDALMHICEILPHCGGIRYVLMENVKGFETSKAHDTFLEALKKSGLCYIREFILSPSQLGVPNTRYRYYCLARKDVDFPFECDRLWDQIPVRKIAINSEFSVKDVLEFNEQKNEELLLTEKVLRKRVWLFDIVTSESTNTNCFTKAYTHYSEGTGSIFTPLSKVEMSAIFEKAKNMDETSEEYIKLLHSVRLRYFTAREVSRLMSFPDEFQFLPETTFRQRYRLLGNSINVLVVGELIKILCS